MKLKDKKVKKIKQDIETELKLNYKIIENFPSKDLILRLHVNVNSLNLPVFKAFHSKLTDIFERQKLYIGRTVNIQEDYYIYFNDKPYQA